jgi:hypothetical protein
MDVNDNLETLLSRFGDRPVQRLRAIAELREELLRAESQEVRRALADGASWTRVGETLGISRQAAHKRHHEAVRNGGAEGESGGEPRVAVAPEAREVGRRAREEARALGHTDVRTAHVLIGIALGSGPAAEALNRAGATPERLRSGLRGVKLVPFDRSSADQLPLSPQVNRALARALRLAVDRGARELRPEHLLIALLEQPDGIARALLERLSASPDHVQPLAQGQA